MYFIPKDRIGVYSVFISLSFFNSYFFLISRTKILNKKQIKKEGAYSDLWFEVFPFTVVGTVWRQENEVAGHIALMVRRQRKTIATVQVALSPRIPAHGMVSPIFK